MNRRPNVWAWMLSINVICIIAIAGCGGPAGPKKYKVTGTVNLDGKPLQAGTINLLDAQGADGGIIKDGAFALEATAGEKKVQIWASKESDKNVEGKDSVKESVSLVPVQYNAKTTLKETVNEGKNEFTFDLKSGGK